eukprot:Gregarina_sp_Poly_1__2768@NODE_176_length_12008_cov_147_545264_g156_i0_p11_GENE_NODE_176_length_12008_cov_147_545264_g156_i0NODE_176_length_12008_cov_147_545264_g156_i0_p11_ORF_typecomplete_len102_score7_52Nsp3_PL2pro/PF12124_8/0_039MGC24/PF05283_11/0_42_NODE_176_length_12008_cov_147_545264_g156_i041984503
MANRSAPKNQIPTRLLKMTESDFIETHLTIRGCYRDWSASLTCFLTRDGLRFLAIEVLAVGFFLYKFVRFVRRAAHEKGRISTLCQGISIHMNPKNQLAFL